MCSCGSLRTLLEAIFTIFSAQGNPPACLCRACTAITARISSWLGLRGLCWNWKAVVGENIVEKGHIIWRGRGKFPVGRVRTFHQLVISDAVAGWMGMNMTNRVSAAKLQYVYEDAIRIMEDRRRAEIKEETDQYMKSLANIEAEAERLTTTLLDDALKVAQGGTKGYVSLKMNQANPVAIEVLRNLQSAGHNAGFSYGGDALCLHFTPSSPPLSCSSSCNSISEDPMEWRFPEVPKKRWWWFF